ncbi:MAG: hypothetical protein DCC43_15515 [Candidatus Brocadia sp.]|nr:hypothetical protein [Anaerolineales bacterium]MDG5997691.1 hypothetical protein [Candidatus Brocadia sp.]RIJ89196.1 MAG: hypothetical protein DCC43_15515 [Candidatus Brocadia sp.]
MTNNLLGLKDGPAWLILCAAADSSALRAACGLTKRLNNVKLVTGEVLACALKWRHTLAGDIIDSQIKLSDGRILRQGEILGVLNRLVFLPPGPVACANDKDREYASQEMTALITSWLYSLKCPVINRPNGQGICPGFLHESEWCWQANRAGFTVRKYSQETWPDTTDIKEKDNFPQTSLRKIFVAGNSLVNNGDLSPNENQACLRLARNLNLDLLEINLVRENEAFIFFNANAFPDIQWGGSPLLDALSFALKGESL